MRPTIRGQKNSLPGIAWQRQDIHKANGGHHKWKVYLWRRGNYTGCITRIAKGTAMSSATFTHSPASSLQHGLQGLAKAARFFADKLFAAQGRQFVAQEMRGGISVSDRAKAKGRSMLFAMARRYDNAAPSLAAELRCIAARD
jgi:hypothetical protein